jgi:HNH endonuclease
VPLCSRPCAYCAKVMKGVTPGTRYCSVECYFDFHVVKREIGCWDWKGIKNKAGYGRMTRGRQNFILAHRFSFERFVGPIPEGMHVLHNCDNPSCPRPDHLFPGTDLDNVHDMLAKGRNGKNYNRGEANSAARLTAEDVVKIRADKRRRAAVAAEYKIGISAVAKIRSRETWAHIK